MSVNAAIMAPLFLECKDGIQVVNVHHKYILHVAEGLHGKGTSTIGVHHLGVV
jgi:hypothetical protein